MKNRINTEDMVYGVAWIVVAGLYLLDIMQTRMRLNESLFEISMVWRMIITLLPFVGLFVINNFILIPRFLLRDRLKSYLATAILVILAVWGYQFYCFKSMVVDRPPMPNPMMRPLIPLPVLLDLIYCLLVVGCNVAITLVFRRFDDALERERMQKESAESQLTYLKAQINPHFYMNMLNNIHGLIELNPERAQAMVIDLSNLMRFMLYDSSKATVSLSDEISFLTNYLRLMRQRYPEDRVRIESSFPSAAESSGISLPPLLFLVFVENAFKHGVSYKKESYVEVSIGLSESLIKFRCRNSVYAGSRTVDEKSGIGLKNISERLRLIYGDKARLMLDETETEYRVILSIPRSI